MTARIPRARLLAPALAVLLLLLAIAPAADARSSSTYRSSGRAASTDWTQWDGTPIGSTFGNVHVGYLEANETSKGRALVDGGIDDFDCEEGEVPGFGGHEFEEPEEGLCDWVGSRSIKGKGVPFTMDRRFNRARLSGQLTVFGGGHGDGGVVGRPMANVTWTGIGDVTTSRYTSRWREGDTQGSDSYRARTRTATMSGTIGPMGFDPDWSSGNLVRRSTSYRERTK